MIFLKKYRKNILCILLAAVILAASPFTAVRAGAVTQDEIDELKDKLAEIEELAEAQQGVIDDLIANKGRVVDRKLALDAKIELTRQQIRLINQQIALYDQLIADTETELEEALTAETAQTELLRSRIRSMEENGNDSYFTFLFEADSLADFLSRIADISDIMHYDQRLEEEYASARENVEEIKRSYEEYHLQEENLRRELDARNTELDAMVEAAETLIDSIGEMSDNAQEEYDAIAELREQTEAEIDELIRKKAAEEEAARRAAAASGGGGGYSGSTAASLSSLMWPVPSCSLITSRFGYRTAPTSGASTYHGGLDIGAGQGATIVAADAGEVILAGANGGYGNCVMISHGNGIVTLYGHMQSVAVGYGQQVSRGQVIGYVGSTGVATAPHCHFEIRVNGGQTDPAPYFSGLTYV